MVRCQYWLPPRDISRDALDISSPIESVLKAANGKKLRVLGRGNLDLKVMSSGKPTTISFTTNIALSVLLVKLGMYYSEVAAR